METFPLAYALASVKGPYHVEIDKPCEDVGGYLSLPFRKEAIFFGAVADGAGSATYGREGALLAVKETLLFFKQHYKSFSLNTFELHVRKLICHLRQLLQKKAEEKNTSFQELSSTLLAFCATSTTLYFFQIGDGFAVMRQDTKEQEGEYQLLTLPQKGEYENETYFLTSNHVYEVVKSLVINPLPSFLALATDGIENAALKKPDLIPYKPFFEPLEAFLEEQEQRNQKGISKDLVDFLKSSRFQEKSSDDKTLLLVKFFKDRIAV